MAGSKDTREDPYPNLMGVARGVGHNQSVALRIIARNRGYDPDAIYDQGTGQVVGSVSRFDTEPQPLRHTPPGRLPTRPVDSWPDGYDVRTSDLRFNAELPFQTPDHTRETRSRRTIDGNPRPGTGE